MRSLAFAAAVLLATARAHAHDIWIEPSTFHPAPGAMVSVGLRVGQNFIGDPVPRLSAFIAAFSVRQNGEDRDVAGSDHIDPAGLLPVDGSATATISYASTGAYIELPPGEFEDYLRVYGLDDVIASRAARGERNKLGRERFYRYAKALITGRDPSAGVTKPVGLAYEIVPSDDPTRRFAPFRGHVLYHGKPFSNALVVALLHGRPSVNLETHSDPQGAITLPLPCPGIWLIKSVHMLAAPAGSTADWVSYWASLTFELPAQQPSDSTR